MTIVSNRTCLFCKHWLSTTESHTHLLTCTMEPSKTILSQKFYQSIKVLLVQGQIFGLITFTFKGIQYQPSKILIFANVLKPAALLLASVYSTYLCLFGITLPKVQKATTTMTLFSTCIYMTVVWIISAINSHKITNFLDKIVDFDTHSAAMSSFVNYNNNRKTTIKRLLKKHFLLLIYFMGLAALSSKFETQLEIVTMVVHAVGTLVSSGFCQQSTELVVMLHTRFTTLNKQLYNIVAHFGNPDFKNGNRKQFLTFCRVCALHHHLSKLIKFFNETFGFMMLFMFGHSFLMITVSIFYLVGLSQTSAIPWMTIYYIGSTCVCYVVDVLMVCHVCYSAVEEVKRKE